tara:strand:- start:17890 stop:18597 length:708 start_codon:yes stop_codon:yes gene_type:complete
MIIDYKNQTVLITGATRGIGKQIAEDMRDAGANLILTGTKPRADDGYFCVDFSDEDSTQDFIKFIEGKKIDVLINNAGINKIDYVCDSQDEDWEKILKVNLTVPYKVLKAVSKNMIKQKYGKIVNISSIWGIRGKEKRVAYSSTKSGLVGLTLSSAAELAQYNVLVNSISPGFTLTDLTKQILGEEGMSELSQQVPMKRLAEPSEISKAVLFIASRMNTYISGQNIVVDGGFTSV